MQTQQSTIRIARDARDTTSTPLLDRPVEHVVLDAVRAVEALDRVLTAGRASDPAPSRLARVALRIGSTLLAWGTRELPRANAAEHHAARHARLELATQRRERSRAELRRLHLER